MSEADADAPLLGGVVALDTGKPAFAYLVLGLQVVLLALFWLLTTADYSADSYAVYEPQLYDYYVGVALMMLVGFGYLMTFLRWYGLGAVGLTMFVTCLGVEVSLLLEPLFADWWSTPITIDLMALLNANYAVAAFLISFGGLIGKVNPTQLTIITVLESACYCFNKHVVLLKWLKVADCGGTIIVHMFGAYFGLAIAYVLGHPTNMKKETSSTVSDVFSLIGTTFLWLYWPSFNAGAVAAGTVEAQTAIVNTVMALLGSTVTTFAVSALLNDGKFSPVDVQNATLAGGVAIGAIANLPIGVCGAAATGSVAGLLSTVGFCRVQACLEERLELHDTCGIHNLHGMPSLLGGLASAIVPLFTTSALAGTVGGQLASIGMTLVVAVGSGAAVGLLIKSPQAKMPPMADDSVYWTVADDFEKKV